MLVVFSSCLTGPQNPVRNYLQPSQIYQVHVVLVWNTQYCFYISCLLHYLDRSFIGLFILCFSKLLGKGFVVVAVFILCFSVGNFLLHHMQSLQNMEEKLITM